MTKVAIIYKLFFIVLLLMDDLNLSTQDPLPRYDRRLRAVLISPPTPHTSKSKRPTVPPTPLSSTRLT
ncbi:hypothetical protein CDL12_17261 [Handroanthus impetiginosus]|uniref:Uncharacterized protein n=1 Tax=Handroanthus impetiginosus TaxID=429701 RepID=A0A2G9GXY2_9LAMI|nr:hypothetical protein CDL12_17261 [Handroanthus impetiginosus]